MDIERRWLDLMIRAELFDLEGRESCGILVPVNCGNGVCCPPASTCVAAGSGSTRPYAERSGCGCNIDDYAAPSDDSTTTRDIYFNGGFHSTGGAGANDFNSSDESGHLCISCSSILGVDVLYLIDVPVFVGWVDECSTGAGVSITPITNGATNGSSRKGNELSTADFVGIAIGAGTALVLLIVLAAAAVIVWRRKSSRKRPRESDLQLITRHISPPRHSFHAHSEPGDAESDIRAKDEPWAMSGAQPMTEEVTETNRGVSWFQLPMPAPARSSLSSTFSGPGPATSLHSHPLARRSTAPSIPQRNDRRSSRGVPRVVRKSSSRSPPRDASPSSGSINRQARVSDSASLGSLSSEAERHLAVDRGRSLGAQGGGELYISRRGSGSSSGEEQRQPVSLLPVFQQPVYFQLPGSSGTIVELI
ncbi:hypothetical protein INS49_002182 [Diaporthe citri]|uniref:uncharacterized protein n=1 Tax=Diaporthe citri TaxID=83186 RepID=UPI001C7FFA50|nr:uncharacterized protein INS49_002182 [Diaporthe citri]KAG6367982.1 hypothetical protein INS49_002182 [Diaporthe citri]